MFPSSATSEEIIGQVADCDFEASRHSLSQFHLEIEMGSTALEGGGLGLDGMVERATQLGGQLTVESKPGAGTRVRVEVPR